jgi:hypothetical protein
VQWQRPLFELSAWEHVIAHAGRRVVRLDTPERPKPASTPHPAILLTKVRRVTSRVTSVVIFLSIVIA